MKVRICAVGRLKSGPERLLVDDYLARFDRAGRPLSLGPAQLVEVEDRKGGGMAAEAVLLRRALPKGALVCALDERGEAGSSIDFAQRLARWRDAGRSEIAFMIGGAGGLDPALRQDADAGWSFGAMVWPHMLARVMLAEQLYRASQILGGTPYHRV